MFRLFFPARPVRSQRTQGLLQQWVEAPADDLGVVQANSLAETSGK